MNLSSNAAATLVASLLTSSIQGADPQLATLVAAEKSAVRLGEPLNVSVRIINQGPQEIRVDRSATAFDCFEVTDPAGQRLEYVGFDGQIMSSPVSVQPGATATISDALDLTDKYLFQKPGQYTIRFNGAVTDLPASRAIEVEVTPGQLSDFDQLAAPLLNVRPKGWRLAKDAHGEVQPFGRSRVSGVALHLCHNHMQGEAVHLWFTKEEAKVIPDAKPDLKTDYLGRARGLYVYAAIGLHALALWPKPIEDIRRALRVTNP